MIPQLLNESRLGNIWVTASTSGSILSHRVSVYGAIPIPKPAKQMPNNWVSRGGGFLAGVKRLGGAKGKVGCLRR